MKIERDGKVYRIRRGKMVEVPPEWVGKTVGAQTINKRPSKQLHKHRKDTKLGTYNVRHKRAEEVIEKAEVQDDRTDDREVKS